MSVYDVMIRIEWQCDLMCSISFMSTFTCNGGGQEARRWWDRLWHKWRVWDSVSRRRWQVCCFV